MGETTTRQCTCEVPSDYNSLSSPDYDRHERGCDLAPNLDDWQFYKHDGELENGGVWVNPSDLDCIYLEVRGYLCRVPRKVRPDVEICGGGSVFYVQPISAAAHNWLDENLCEGALRSSTGGVSVEHRYIEPLINAMREAGFRIG
jgi:hypothetical protein